MRECQLIASMPCQSCRVCIGCTVALFLVFNKTDKKTLVNHNVAISQ
jgi:hypothetical protein